MYVLATLVTAFINEVFHNIFSSIPEEGKNGKKRFKTAMYNICKKPQLGTHDGLCGKNVINPFPGELFFETHNGLGGKNMSLISFPW